MNNNPQRHLIQKSLGIVFYKMIVDTIFRNL